MTKITYNLITLGAFIISAVAEIIIRDGAAFTLTGFVFYGLYHLIINGMYLISENENN